VPCEAQERRQQGDRDEDHDQHEHRDGDAGSRHERYAGDGEPEDRDDHRAACEGHRMPGGGDRPADRFLDRHPAREELAVPHHDHEGVVDAHSQADHDAHHRSEARDLDDVRDQRHRADSDRQPEQSHADRQAHGDERSECQQQHDHRGDQADQLAEARLRLLEDEEEVAAQLDLQRRTGADIGPQRLELRQVAGPELLHSRVLRAQHGDPAVRRDRLGRAEHLRELRHRGPDCASSACAPVEPEKVSPASRGVITI
jgi:hypothetical protein